MNLGNSIGKYILTMKSHRHDGLNEIWVFISGDRAVEWDSRDGIPSEENLDTL